jgi:hypothetical protein
VRQWTIIYDHRQAYAAATLDETTAFPIYIREGVGSFGISSMHKVDSAEDLEKLMNTPVDQLPEKARAPTTGFYARFMAAGPAQRKKLVEAALAREKARIARRKERQAA